jgi:CDGSH-type Zn-finger protein
MVQVTWNKDVEVTSYVLVFSPEYAKAQRGTAAMLCRCGYSDVSIICLLGL